MRITVGAHELKLHDPAIFGAGHQIHARRFVCRVMALPAVRSVTLEPQQGTAIIVYRAAPQDRKDVLARLAQAAGTDALALDDAALPEWRGNEAVTLTRAGEVITTLRIIEARPGHLRVGHHTLSQQEGALARRTERSLRHLRGVTETAANSPSGTLTILFDPAVIDTQRILRAIEVELFSGQARRAAEPEPVPFGIANTTLGLGTVGELMLPLATPVAAGILVATNLSVARDAAVQLTRGQVGLPMFQTALLACSIATGQVLAFAMTEWSLRYWQRHWRRNLAKETRVLLDETLPFPEQGRLIAADGQECAVPFTWLRPGERARVMAAEPIAVDGRVLAGEALVDESLIRGGRGPVRKTIGDEVFAGSSVLVGALDIEVQRTGRETSAARVADTLVDVTRDFPRDRAMQRKSEQLADRTVLPTLATAGVGWAAGDLITVGAILHQDWVSGPALALPLLTLNHMRAALRSGALVCSATAIQRLSQSDFVVLDGDDPQLAMPTVELADLQSQLPDTDTVLRHVAGAGLYLGDERSLALVNACHERGLIVRQPTLAALGPGRLDVQLGEHTIRLIDTPTTGSSHPASLQVEIDGTEVAHLHFRPGARPRAAEAVARLRAGGRQTFLVSSASDSVASTLAHSLGVDLSGGELDTDGRIRFLQGLRRRGVQPTYVGHLSEHPELATEAYVSVSLGELNGGEVLASDVALLGGCYESLADLVNLADAFEPTLVGAARMATIPNLLCIAGAFGGLLNGITAGIIANIGVMNVDRQLRRTLAASARPRDARRVLMMGS